MTPSATPTEQCADSEEWYFKHKGDNCGCSCIAEKKNPQKYCKKRESEDGIKAKDACQLTCDTCEMVQPDVNNDVVGDGDVADTTGAGVVDSPTWYYLKKREACNCACVAEQKSLKGCKKRGEGPEDTRYGYEACPETCSVHNNIYTKPIKKSKKRKTT